MRKNKLSGAIPGAGRKKKEAKGHRLNTMLSYEAYAILKGIKNKGVYISNLILDDTNKKDE